MADEPLYYSEYLHLDRLLDCQEPESAKYGPPAHDEMLFIIVQQVYELWFKQIIHELDAVLDIFRGEVVDDKDMGRAVAYLGRIAEIQRLLIAQIDVLETMTPLDFLEFRDYLIPASAFQSLQFRLIENKMGVKAPGRVRIEGAPYTSRFSEEDRRALAASESEPSLFELVERWLERTPFLELEGFDFWKEYRHTVEATLASDRKLVASSPTLSEAERRGQLRELEATEAQFEALLDSNRHESMTDSHQPRLSHRALQAALLINLYRDEPILQLPFRLLTLLMDIDEGFTNWRDRHALMALRMIGSKIGTGGTSGHDYLRRSAEQTRVFGDLFNLSTFFIPRSAIPRLPPKLEREMGFYFTTGTT